MRLCRFYYQSAPRWGLYQIDCVVAIDALVAERLGWPVGSSWEFALPIGEQRWTQFVDCIAELERAGFSAANRLLMSDVKLLPPLARPPKLLLLAGNYAEHVREQGGTAAEKLRTFPYVFSKPPSTTLIGSGTPFTIPQISPSKLDHEVELAIVIGRTLRQATADDARQAIVGYTAVNDISDRGFRPNPEREQRPRDTFFDWLHGKWHDGSCPCGPCMVTADAIADPQQLSLTLSIDGAVRQSGSTSQMIFSVYEIVAFISSFITLEPGDIISTGTPAGVGNATGRYLQRGQTMTASIQSIGELITPIV